MIQLLLAAALSAASLCAQAQYPQKPIRIIIGLGAGGVADGMTRTITDKITPTLGQPFVLENRPGAGGNIAMEAVIKAPADGHTLLLIGPALVINPALYTNLSFDPLKDLASVTTIAIAPFALFASATLPVTNVGELVAYGKQKKMNYASVGAGTAGHLAAVMFGAAAGLELTHVPYRSIQMAIPDLVQGAAASRWRFRTWCRATCSSSSTPIRRSRRWRRPASSSSLASRRRSVCARIRRSRR